MACHPYDPPGLPFGYQGADNWDSPSIFDAIKRYEAVVDSPYNGFQLCLGTAGEGLKNPRTEILPIVRYLGERGKIYQIHMRNIRGGLHDFEEVYPDEGEMDFFQVMRILRDTQFAGSICPDHMPRHPDDSGGLQAFAFGYGYIKALIQAVNSEVWRSDGHANRTALGGAVKKPVVRQYSVRRLRVDLKKDGGEHRDK